MQALCHRRRRALDRRRRYGNAIEVNASIAFHHVQVYDTDSTLTFDKRTRMRHHHAPQRHTGRIGSDGDALRRYEPHVRRRHHARRRADHTAHRARRRGTGELPAVRSAHLLRRHDHDAIFAGTAAVCVPYPDADDDGLVDGTTPPIAETSLRMLHEEQDVFVDRTISLDEVTNTICAGVSSFSQFVLGRVDGAAATCGNSTSSWANNATTAMRCRGLLRRPVSVRDGRQQLLGRESLHGRPVRRRGRMHRRAGQRLPDCVEVAPAAEELRRRQGQAALEVGRWTGSDADDARRSHQQRELRAVPLCRCRHTAHRQRVLPAGADWVALSDKGYKFKGASPNGLSLALLKGGSAGKSKALAKGRGATLPDPTLPLVFPVTVQLRKSGSPLCLESTFASTDEVKNEGGQFEGEALAG